MYEWNGFDYGFDFGFDYGYGYDYGYEYGFGFDYDNGFVLITLMAIEKDRISSP